MRATSLALILILGAVTGSGAAPRSGDKSSETPPSRIPRAPERTLDPPSAPDLPSPRPRARSLGLAFGSMAPGPRNDITDVAGVRVGHATLREEPRFNTGVTAVLPHGGNLFLEKVPAAIVVGNGFGKLAGSTQVNELGEIETPVLLTATLSVPKVADGLIAYMLALPGMEEVRSINPLVAETNDGFLSDIRARPLGEREVRAAIEAAGTGPVEMGAVGAGAGTVCFGFKGGIGSASRRLAEAEGGWTVGVLVQTNFGGALRLPGLPASVEGIPLGEHLLRVAAARGERADGRAAAQADEASPGPARYQKGPAPSSGGAPVSGPPRAEPPSDSSGGAPASGPPRTKPPSDAGSLIVVVATDAPLDHRNLRRLAARSLYGMALTGGYGANGSGDYAIAFSTHEGVRIRPSGAGGAPPPARPLGNDAASPLFRAVVEATEEAIVDSLFTARSVRGHRGSAPALPVDEILSLARRRPASN